jgi:hypothetical protein
VSACEKCWDLAFIASRTGPESQAEAYYRILREHDDDPEHVAPKDERA